MKRYLLALVLATAFGLGLEPLDGVPQPLEGAQTAAVAPDTGSEWLSAALEANALFTLPASVSLTATARPTALHLRADLCGACAALRESRKHTLKYRLCGGESPSPAAPLRAADRYVFALRKIVI